MDMTDNTIFIPGATSGIGLALARRLQDRGNTVIIGGRRTHRLEQLHADHGFTTVLIDVTDPDGIRAAADEVIAGHPELNGLITMAGIMAPEDWHSTDGFLPTAEAEVITNLLGTIRLIGAFVEQLISVPRATIITVSSGLASVPLAITPTYNATKAAIHMLSEGVRLQLADTNVQVIELVPPAVATTLLNQQDNPHAMDLDQFADETMNLLADQPASHEILVENVRFLRYAEQRGTYDAVVAQLNGNPSATTAATAPERIHS